MVDLTTSWLGLPLRNPLVASASAISKKNERVKALEDAGIGAVVMYSLFEERSITRAKRSTITLKRIRIPFPKH